MNKETLNKAIDEAERFVRQAKACRALAVVGDGWVSYSPKQSGSTKRASMGLTRALSDLRRPG